MWHLPGGKGSLLTSVVWDLAPIYSELVEDLRADRFGTRDFRLSLADDSVRLLKTSHIPEAVWTEVMAVRDKIVRGSLSVPEVTRRSASSRAGDCCRGSGAIAPSPAWLVRAGGGCP